MNELMNKVAALAQQASQVILEIYQRDDVGERMKDDRSPLTEADLAANHVLSEGLQALTPQWPIVSEEGSTAFPKGASHWWLVDPLDGTREFVSKNGDFTVNVALMEGMKAVAGVVTVPVHGTAYIAADGKACRVSADGIRTPIHTRPLGSKEIVVAASRSHLNVRTQMAMTNAERDRHVVRHAVGSSLKVLRVAEGQFDCYPRFAPTSSWDIAAAQAIVEAAGGAILGPQWMPLTHGDGHWPLNPEFVVVGDPSVNWGDLLGVEPNPTHE